MFALSYSSNKEYLEENFDDLMPHVKTLSFVVKKLLGSNIYEEFLN